MASDLWIFGYGSLIWNPGFEHSKALIGQIKGYSRKFYQGSDVHRGRPDRMGRVVTLIEDGEGSTWGQAFLPKDHQIALSYLGQRESSIGGYETALTYFYPRDPKEKPFLILVYIAMPSNALFLGADPIPKIAHDIAHSEGECGHNVEYLSKLIAFMRVELPHIVDDHLFSIEKEVRDLLEKAQNTNVMRLFSDAIDAWITRPALASIHAIEEMVEHVKEEFDSGDSSEFKFVDSVPKRKIRCVHKY